MSHYKYYFGYCSNVIAVGGWYDLNTLDLHQFSFLLFRIPLGKLPFLVCLFWCDPAIPVYHDCHSYDAWYLLNVFSALMCSLLAVECLFRLPRGPIGDQKIAYILELWTNGRTQLDRLPWCFSNDKYRTVIWTNRNSKLLLLSSVILVDSDRVWPPSCSQFYDSVGAVGRRTIMREY